ncbi:FAD-dependent oxidoreductase [Paenibacillus sp. KACC 21273]|uniref:flavin monoamine oxidase family protein n=1 Tax=Paenibacillus sp. KACC 21273 TaxID=3025665 RepID=UPI002367020B|nr:FAD-dependent oxidoreductase [Paenibacillus sp. KACC 21273]WDF48857.1 FAD-dependent oxidoreductase [Paenibacillus sp. KACC 21273]
MTFTITKEKPVVIIGAGVSGLHTAALLSAQHIPCQILEARDRIGGRVFSKQVSDHPELGTFDVGPTWFWPRSEPYITKLAKDLELETFPQFNSGDMVFEQVKNQQPQRHTLKGNSMELSMRFAGGVEALTNALAAQLPTNKIKLQHRVTAISQQKDHFVITIEGKEDQIYAGAVVIALPPRVAARRITFSPELSPDVTDSLMSKPTWMAGQAKVVAVYETPFWRNQGLSGLATSWVGPLQEIHDASSINGAGALFGFFGISAQERSDIGKENLLESVQQQLIRLFGPLAKHNIALLYKDWSTDPETATLEDAAPLRDYPMYGSILAKQDTTLPILFTGTETDSSYGGHLEGALRAADQVVSRLISNQ